MLKRQLVQITTLTLLTGLLLAACSPATPVPTQTLLPTSTPTVQLVDLALITPAEVEPTNTPLPTQTPTATASPAPSESATPEVTATESVPSCTNQAEFVKHLSISDNTSIKATYYFKKIWRIKNVGTCTWNTDYRLVFQSGNQMNGPDYVNLPHVVAPQETVDIELILIAPEIAGPYNSSWMLQDESENLFGVGIDYQDSLKVIIVVADYTENNIYDNGDSVRPPSSGGGGGG